METVGVFSSSNLGVLTIQDARDAALFRVGALVLLNGDTQALVTGVSVDVGVVTVDSTFVDSVSSVLVESAWPKEVIRALHNLPLPLDERILDAAVAAAERNLRIRRVSAAVAAFSAMVRLRSAKIEFDELTEATWVDLMTACGPVRVFADRSLKGDQASLDVDERMALYTTDRSRQQPEQLRRRAELETEDAENLMARVELTRAELARRT